MAWYALYKWYKDQSGADAERVFLETITELLDDEAKYYAELKNMCKELIS